ncbi:MAG: S1C family serine protease [Fibrobacterota bacterium]
MKTLILVLVILSGLGLGFLITRAIPYSSGKNVLREDDFFNSNDSLKNHLPDPFYKERGLSPVSDVVSYKDAIELVSDNIVLVGSGKHDRRSSSVSELLGESTGESFDGAVFPSYGAGLIVTPDGIVVTAQHITSGSFEIIVKTSNGNEYDAEVLFTDSASDLSFLKIKETGFKELSFETNDFSIPGTRIISFGNPFSGKFCNFKPVVVSGIIGSVNRSFSYNGRLYYSMIQSDIPAISGFSGGPIVDSKGNILGINTVIMFSSGSYGAGLTFSVSSGRVKALLKEYSRYGTIRKTFYGMTFGVVNEKPKGLEIINIDRRGPAKRAGLRLGDIIIKAGGCPVFRTSDFDAVINNYLPNSRVNLVIFRENRFIKKTIILSKRGVE